MLDLRGRGQGRRESGAFILGRRHETIDRACSYVPYDELDPEALATGIVRFSSGGYAKLWELCRARAARVVADVHTHPTDWVQQSDSDQAHPMIPERLHAALILPRFGDTTWWSLEEVGIHEYHGGGRWRSPASPGRVRLTWF